MLRLIPAGIQHAPPPNLGNLYPGPTGGYDLRKDYAGEIARDLPMWCDTLLRGGVDVTDQHPKLLTQWHAHRRSCDGAVNYPSRSVNDQPWSPDGRRVAVWCGVYDVYQKIIAFRPDNKRARITWSCEHPLCAATCVGVKSIPRSPTTITDDDGGITSILKWDMASPVIAMPFWLDPWPIIARLGWVSGDLSRPVSLQAFDVRTNDLVIAQELNFSADYPTHDGRCYEHDLDRAWWRPEKRSLWIRREWTGRPFPEREADPSPQWLNYRLKD